MGTVTTEDILAALDKIRARVKSGDCTNFSLEFSNTAPSDILDPHVSTVSLQLQWISPAPTLRIEQI